MNTPLNDDTQQEARDLARKITVAHDLDPEIQEELYGHIEDKLLAYKSGEERVSDEDAFILVREHFGDVKVLKNMFQDTHVVAVQETMLRRLLVAVITTLACVQLAAWPAYVADVFVHWPNTMPYSSYYFRIAVTGVALLTPWLLFVRWKRRMELGERVWFSGWSTVWLGFAAFGLFATSLIVPPNWALIWTVTDFTPPSSPLDALRRVITGREWSSQKIAIGLTLLMINTGALTALVFHFARRIPSERFTARPRTSKWLRLITLTAAIAAVNILDVVALNVAAEPIGDVKFSMGRLLTWYQLEFLLVLALCCSWIWWCDSTPRLFRNSVQSGLAWAALMLAYAVTPALQAGIVVGNNAPKIGEATNLLKLQLPETEIWLYLNRAGNFFYLLPHVVAASVVVVFFALTAILTFRLIAAAQRTANEASKVA